MSSFEYLELLKLAAPETLVILAALAVLTIDLLILREQRLEHRFLIGGAFAIFGCLGALALTVNTAAQTSFLGGLLVSDPLIRMVKITLLALAICTILLSLRSTFTAHVGEYLALILLSTVGMLFMASSEELLTIFVSLELTSLSLYILTAFNKTSLKSAEAALKYFLFGGMSAAFTLFGLSLIYGLSGSTYLRPISEALRSQQPVQPLLLMAIGMTVVGFGFKVAAAPFHLWAPDAYQGAPTPSAAFIASGSKVASFFLFAKILMIGFYGTQGSGAWKQFAAWVPALAAVAAASMILGNLAAIVQSNVKRLLAYSAIAHAGYALVAVVANSKPGMASLVYYIITYSLTVVGAFGVVHLVEQQMGNAAMVDFAGLSRRAPVLSLCMLVFMLSLAGIPPTAGFFGKFYVFIAAIGSGTGMALLWLVVLAIAASAVSLYYYLQVLKQIYVADPPAAPIPVRIPWISQAALCGLALAVVILGCAPDLLVGRLVEAAQLAGL